MIREATANDVIRVVDMIEDLRAAVQGPIPVDRAWTARTVAGLIASDDGAIWITDGGFIAGVIEPTIISPTRVAKEMGWYSRDRSGLLLLRAFEGWARVRNATLIQLSTGAEGLDLSRFGYRIAERAWVK